MTPQNDLIQYAESICLDRLLINVIIYFLIDRLLELGLYDCDVMGTTSIIEVDNRKFWIIFHQREENIELSISKLAYRRGRLWQGGLKSYPLGLYANYIF
jgi:hypothetical protein